MHIELPPQKEKQFACLAASLRTAPVATPAQTMDRWLEEDARFRAAVQIGPDEIDRGEVIGHEGVFAQSRNKYQL